MCIYMLTFTEESGIAKVKGRRDARNTEEPRGQNPVSKNLPASEQGRRRTGGAGAGQARRPAWDLARILGLQEPLTSNSPVLM